MQSQGSLQQWIATSNLKNLPNNMPSVEKTSGAWSCVDLFGSFADDEASWITCAVDAMAKPGQNSLLLLHFLDEIGHVVRRTNLGQHSNYRLVRTALSNVPLNVFRNQGTLKQCLGQTMHLHAGGHTMLKHSQNAALHLNTKILAHLRSLLRQPSKDPPASSRPAALMQQSSSFHDPLCS